MRYIHNITQKQVSICYGMTVFQDIFPHDVTTDVQAHETWDDKKKMTKASGSGHFKG